LDKSKLTLETGKTSQLTATVNPDNASNKNVYWESSNTYVATVSATGLVTAKSTGTARISVISGNNPSIKTYCDVTVTPLAIPVTGVSLNKTTLTLETGATEQLTATISPSNATNKMMNWSTSNSSVALVSNTGYINTLSEGTTTITVTTEDGNKTATCEITVSDEKTGTAGLLTWKLSNGTLTISGTGAMPNYTGNAPWNDYSISNVIIESGVINIGNSAFSAPFSSRNNLKSVTIPNTVTKIGSSAFSGNSSLESISIPSSVTDIGGYAFSSCALITVVIPDNVKTIGSRTFSGCQSLQTVTIGASVTNINDYAFLNCRNLTKVFVKRSTPPTLYKYDYYYITFDGTPIDKATLIVPIGSKAAYQNAGGWSDFGTIIEE
jgi:hypothetical protein